MKKNLFDYDDYLKYLEAKLGAMPSGGRGVRAQLADALGVQRPFISQVFQGRWDFSLEHAEAINRFFHHDSEEANFFLLLVQRARAGTPALRERLQNQILQVRERRRELKNRISAANNLSSEDQEIYFSSWLYQAAQVATDIEKYRTRGEISRYLKISEDRAGVILAFLCRVGLLEESGGGYKSGHVNIHLDRGSAFINKFHYNWRVRAMASLDAVAESDAHFSSCFSLSHADCLEIRKELFDLIERVQKRVKDTKSEEAVALCLDFFKLYGG